MPAKNTKKTQSGIRFFNCVWNTGTAYQSTTESAFSRRHMNDKIKTTKEVSYFNEDGTPWELVKIQDIETPMIEVEWLRRLFTKAGNRKDRESHAKQAVYILLLVEACAARILFEDGRVIER